MSDLTPLVLIEPSDVHAVMGSDPDLLAAVTPSFESAIVRAGLKLRTVLGTSLAPLYNTDTFYIGDDLPTLHGRYRLLLRNGLVRSDVAYTVQWSADLTEEFQDVANAVMDFDRGFVQVPAVDQGAMVGARWRRSDTLALNSRFYVRVVYASGLCTERDEATDYEELRQALLCYVPQLLLSTSSAVEGKGFAVTMKKAGNLNDAADDMLQRFMRRVAPSVRPFQHTHTVLTTTQT